MDKRGTSKIPGCFLKASIIPRDQRWRWRLNCFSVAGTLVKIQASSQWPTRYPRLSQQQLQQLPHIPLVNDNNDNDDNNNNLPIQQQRQGQRMQREAPPDRPIRNLRSRVDLPGRSKDYMYRKDTST